MTEWAIIAVSFHLASGLAYVIGGGVVLTQQDRDQRFTRIDGPDLAFRRFRRVAATLMINDCLSFIALCVLTGHTLRVPLGTPQMVGIGVVLVAIGAWMKTWAAVRIGFAACYWQNFFVPSEPAPLDPPGPYRFLKNPMYTLGYLYTYGLALVFASLPGLILAAFDQAAILAFYYRVEKPHFEQLSGAAFDSVVGGD